MKVKDLIAELNQCNPEDDVVIPVELGYPTLGGHPIVNLSRIERGFDWDSRKVFLYPDEGKSLTPMSKDQYTSLIQYKQLVMGMRGKEELASLSDIFVRKEFVINLLKTLSEVPFDTEIMTAIKEEQL